MHRPQRRSAVCGVPSAVIRREIRELLGSQDADMLSVEEGEVPGDGAQQQRCEAAFELFCECFERLKDEKNVFLFIRIVGLVDAEVVREVLSATELNVAAGDESARIAKSAGGTFLKLLKQRLCSETVREVWREQAKRQHSYKQRKRFASALDLKIAGVKRRKNCES